MTRVGRRSGGSFRVLGVDPGSLRTGWGFVGGSAARPRVLDCGLIDLGRGLPLPERLSKLQRELDEIVRRLRPTSAAVESPFHGASARSALQLAHARGVVLAVLGGAGITVTEYSPATVKKSVTGNGRAGKEQVSRMVGRLLDHAADDWAHDLSDALAVALCHLSMRSFETVVERSHQPR
jgi:crossover junction endodeoxyribonuclease RuvC